MGFVVRICTRGGTHCGICAVLTVLTVRKSPSFVVRKFENENTKIFFPTFDKIKMSRAMGERAVSPEPMLFAHVFKAVDQGLTSTTAKELDM